MLRLKHNFTSFVLVDGYGFNRNLEDENNLTILLKVKHDVGQSIQVKEVVLKLPFQD